MLKNIIILLSAAVIFAVLWYSGLERIYAHAIVIPANMGVSLVSKQSKISVERTERGLTFMVSTFIDGRKGTYPQRMGTLLLPTLIMLSWQIVLFFRLRKKDLINTSLLNWGVFMGFQVLFLMLLVYYYKYEAAKYFYHLMMEAFYVLALVIIIQNNIKHPHIRISNKEANG